jgi:hypothetical protein
VQFCLAHLIRDVKFLAEHSHAAKGLSTDKVAKAGEGVVPVGQLWLRKWTLVIGSKPVPNDRLRIVTVKAHFPQPWQRCKVDCRLRPWVGEFG